MLEKVNGVCFEVSDRLGDLEGIPRNPFARQRCRASDDIGRKRTAREMDVIMTLPLTHLTLGAKLYRHNIALTMFGPSIEPKA